MKKIFRIIFIVICLLYSSTIVANIASGKAGSMDWVISDEGILTVSGNGAIPDYSIVSDAPWRTYRNSVRHIVLEEGITTIGSYAFRDMQYYTSASLPSTLKTLKTYAFYGCTRLETIVIPQSVTSIGFACFAEGYALNDVVIKSKSLSIGWRCFWACKKLSKLTCYSTTVPTLNSEVFGGGTLIASGYLYVPESLVNSYKTADQWKNWANIISIESLNEEEKVPPHNALFIWEPDGSHVCFLLKERPQVQYTHTHISISTPEGGISYPVTKRMKFTFGDVDDETTDVKSIVEESKAIINLSSESVNMSNLSPGERIVVYTTDGKVFGITNADSNGEVVLTFANAQRDIYIIKTKHTSFKFLKK